MTIVEIEKQDQKYGFRVPAFGRPRNDKQLLLHDHLGADRNAFEEIHDLFVDQPEAA